MFAAGISSRVIVLSQVLSLSYGIAINIPDIFHLFESISQCSIRLVHGCPLDFFRGSESSHLCDCTVTGPAV